MGAARYRFGDFDLDVRARELRRRGQPVALPLKSFDCLVYLLEHRDRAVGRDELISAVWGRVDVNDALLGQTLARARRALDDTGEEQRVIRTVPRFGYRWVMDVQESAEHDAAPPAADSSPAIRDDTTVRRDNRRLPMFVAAGVLLAIAAVAVWHFQRPPEPSVPHERAADSCLVLPVRVREADAASGWIRLGGMDYIASLLRDRGGLPVLPSEQAIAYLAQRGDREPGDGQRLEIAQRAGATWAIAASAQRSDEGWSVDLDAQDAERSARFHATAATPLEAIENAVTQFLASVGRAGVAAERIAPSELELQQRIDAAFLEGNVRQAQELIESAPVGLQNAPAIAVRAAEVDERSGRMEQAQRAFTRVADAGNPPAVRGRALYGLCAIAYRRAEIDSAQQHCGEALRLLGEHADPQLLGRIYMLRGVIDDERGDFEGAMTGFGLARLQWRRAGNLPGEASVDANEGLAQTRRNHFADAVADFDRAAAILSRFGVDDHLASVLAAKSDAQRQMLDLDGALASSAQAWQLTARVADARRVRAVGYSRTLCLLASGKLDEAAHVIERFRDSFAAAPEFDVLKRRLLTEQGQPAQAVVGADDLLDRVLTPADPTSDASLSEAANVLADAALRGGDPALADHVLQRLRDAGALDRDPDRAWVAALTSARLADVRRDDATADTQFAAALELAADRPDLIAATAAADVAYLLSRQRADEAMRVAGRLTLYVDRDFQAARAMEALYRAIGDAASADRLRVRLPALA
ncbi:MAG TPA: transcriptional regulator, partial [Rudaea sp.]